MAAADSVLYAGDHVYRGQRTAVSAGGFGRLYFQLQLASDADHGRRLYPVLCGDEESFSEEDGLIVGE